MLRKNTQNIVKVGVVLTTILSSAMMQQTLSFDEAPLVGNFD